MENYHFLLANHLYRRPSIPWLRDLWGGPWDFHMVFVPSIRDSKDSLVGGIPTPVKNMKVSWDYFSQYMEKYLNKSKPPTSFAK